MRILLPILAAIAFVCLIFGGAGVVFGQTYSLSPEPSLYFADANGAPYASAKLCSYLSGTSTPSVTYSDNLGSTNGNPVTVGTDGRVTVYLNAALSYKLELRTAAATNCSTGSVIWSRDNVSAVAPTTISGTSGFLSMFNPAGTNVTNSCVSALAGALNASSCTTVSIPVRRSIPDISPTLVVSTGNPVTSVIGTAVTVTGLTSTTSSGVSIGFKVPTNDVVITGTLALGLGYSVDTAPGTSNTKVKLNMTCVVNGTAAAATTDTITLANNTTPANYAATLNVCGASTYAAGDDVVVTVTRDTTVANNSVVWFFIRRWKFLYTASQ